MAAVTASISASALVSSATARADTLSSDRAQAAQITAQLSQLNQAEAAADERYNQSQITLSTDQARQTAAQEAEQAAAAAVAAKRSILQQAAVNAYVEGGQQNSIAELVQSDAADVGAAESYLNSVVDTQQSAVDGFRAAQATLTQQESVLAKATKAAAKQVNQIATLRQNLNATASQESSTLNQVKGQIAQIVAADEAAAAAAAAARAKAAYEAQQAALAAQAQAQAQANQGDGSGLGNYNGNLGNGLPPALNANAQEAINYAQAQLGKPYEYGAAGPNSFDCSGLTMDAWGAAGVGLPHSAAGQWDDTVRVSYAQLEPGDLVFFYQPVDHVGIYVGNGTMIDAPHTGANVEYDSIWWSSLDGFGRVT
ncbi:MAG TPA: NlpC/P60 family protein [Acidimicrobiales bacterium]|nr:NlpC/P60 family protein [Acidimicrobiales bacterium]